ncbi:FAD-dependent oxidoreductase [Candidatus Microgenomates bacterium]|nr:FAD-dependent oxidoreductase [Candidatus Microgenomates bacterium]
MIYDLIIIGIGPAGLTASIYASRYKLSHLVIGQKLGGAITLASNVENFPGFNSISGFELGEKMLEQVKYLGAEVVSKTVGRVEKLNDHFKVITEDNTEYEAKTLIVATGTERRKLNVPGEQEYLGKGVSYCTTCDAPFFRGKTVALVGGSDAAVSGAVHAAQFAQKVYIIYRGEALRAEPVWLEDAKKDPKIVQILKTNLKEIKGDGVKITGVVLDSPYQGSDQLSLEGVFIEIGGVPGTSLLIPLGVEIDKNGFVKVNEWMETNIPGLFAAGDFTTSSYVLQQAISACAQGATAAAAAFKCLKGQKAPQILG